MFGDNIGEGGGLWLVVGLLNLAYGCDPYKGTQGLRMYSTNQIELT